MFASPVSVTFKVTALTLRAPVVVPLPVPMLAAFRVSAIPVIVAVETKSVMAPPAVKLTTGVAAIPMFPLIDNAPAVANVKAVLEVLAFSTIEPPV